MLSQICWIGGFEEAHVTYHDRIGRISITRRMDCVPKSVCRKERGSIPPDSIVDDAELLGSSANEFRPHPLVLGAMLLFSSSEVRSSIKMELV